MITALKRWAPLISKFLSGQAAVQLINLVTALMLLRLLSVDEYALFIVANLFLVFGSTGSDLNLSTAFTTYGARVANNKLRLSILFSTVLRFRRWFYLPVMLLVLISTPYMTKGHGWEIGTVSVIIFLVLMTNWVQQTASLRNVVLNIYQDLTGIFQSSVISATLRLVLIYALCLKWPVAPVAVFANFVVVIFTNWLLKQKCQRYIEDGVSYDKEVAIKLKAFIFPLLPASIYFAFQGQISIFLISFFGDSKSIAEVGALGRFGQIFAFLGILNGFLFHPKFSTIGDRTQFFKKGVILTSILMTGFGCLWLSTIAVPGWWLLLLGKNYDSLAAEVPLAMAEFILNYFVNLFFTMLAARAYTQGQFWYVLATLLMQVLFIIFIGVDTTHKALQLNLMNAIVTLFVEAMLLGVLFRNWR